MPQDSRPLSPHLQIYRPQITTVLSIAHRGSGILLSLGLPVLVYWLFAAAAGRDSYSSAQGLLGSVPGRVLLFGWTFAFCFHLCNGLRHLAWDAGWGFEIRTVYRSGWLVVTAAVLLTLLVWGAGLTMGRAT